MDFEAPWHENGTLDRFSGMFFDEHELNFRKSGLLAFPLHGGRPMKIEMKDVRAQTSQRVSAGLDLLWWCGGRVKALSALADEHRAQVHNYLKATGHRVAWRRKRKGEPEEA